MKMKPKEIYFFAGMFFVFAGVCLVDGQIFSMSVFPENQTVKLESKAEYKIEINISNLISGRAECYLDGSRLQEARPGDNKVIKKVVFASDPPMPKKVKISHNLYCKLVDQSVLGKTYDQNETMEVNINFEAHQMNVRMEAENYTKLNCSNPSASLKGKVYNNGVKPVTCSYSKIYKSVSGEKILIPSSIEPFTSSTFYFDASLSDIPDAIRIFCYDGYGQSIINTAQIKIDYDNSINLLIEECRREIDYITKFIDAADEMKDLKKAVSFRDDKDCYWAKFYAEKCLNSTKEKKKQIDAASKETKTEEKQVIAKEEMKKNASELISSLKTALSEIDYSNKDNLFVKLAEEMLTITQNKFWSGDYEESIEISKEALNDVEKAKDMIKKAEAEKEKEIQKQKEKAASEKAEMEAQKKNITVTEEKKPSIDLITWAIVLSAFIIAAVAIFKIRKTKKEKKEKEKADKTKEDKSGLV